MESVVGGKLKRGGGSEFSPTTTTTKRAREILVAFNPQIRREIYRTIPKPTTINHSTIDPLSLSLSFRHQKRSLSASLISSLFLWNQSLFFSDFTLFLFPRPTLYLSSSLSSASLFFSLFLFFYIPPFTCSTNWVLLLSFWFVGFRRRSCLVVLCASLRRLNVSFENLHFDSLCFSFCFCLCGCLWVIWMEQGKFEYG